MTDQISFVCNDLNEEEIMCVTKVMSQTNYDDATARIKLSEFGFSVERVLRNYMGILDVKVVPKVKSVNQEIYKQSNEQTKNKQQI